MAVRLETTIKRFLGLSSDSKPLLEVPAGSSYLETDTGTIWRFDGRYWQAAPSGNDIVPGLLMELLTEQQRTNELLEVIAERL